MSELELADEEVRPYSNNNNNNKSLLTEGGEKETARTERDPVFKTQTFKTRKERL